MWRLDRHGASVWAAGVLDLKSWLTDTTARPVATERISADWVGGQP